MSNTKVNYARYDSYYGVYVEANEKGYDKLMDTLQDYFSERVKKSIQKIIRLYPSWSEVLWDVLDVVCDHLELSSKSIGQRGFILGVRQCKHNTKSDPVFSVKDRARVIDLFADQYKIETIVGEIDYAQTTVD